MRLPLKPLLRDAVIWLSGACVWWSLLQAGDGAHVVHHVVAGVMAVAAAATLHEWGHLAGALATGSVVHFPNRVLTLLLFDFDIARNNRRQFIWLGMGGYIGSLIGAGLLFLALPAGVLASQIAWAGVALGTLATFVIEVPATIRVMRGGELPRALFTVTDAAES